MLLGLWLGQPCALLRSLGPGAGDLVRLRLPHHQHHRQQLLLCRSVACGEATAGRGVPGAAPALVGLLLCGREEKRRRPPLRPSGGGRRCAVRQEASRTAASPPLRLWFPFGAGESQGSRRGLHRPSCSSLAAGQGPDPRWMHVQRSPQAPGTGEEPPGGSRKGTGGSPTNDPAYPSQEDGQKPNKSQQLKKVFKEYGGVAVAFHVGISLMSLGMFYLALSSGVDMTAILFKLGFDEAVVQSKLAAGTSTFLLAYAIHKLFAPVRISITLISVPLLVRYFRKIGFFKPPAPNP